MRNPDRVVGRHAHAVGDPQFLGHADNRAAVADRRIGWIKVEGPDLACWRINEEHVARVCGPAEAVGDGQAVENAGEGVSVQTVKRSSAFDRSVVRHRADPESSGGVELAVVGPVAGKIGFDLADGGADGTRVPIQPRHAFGERDQKSSVGMRSHSTDGLVKGPGLDGTSGRVEGMQFALG